MKTGYVLVSSTLGVFLGLVPDPFGQRPMGLWSRSVGSPFFPDHAIAFDSPVDVFNLASLMDPDPPGVQAVRVEVDLEDCGTMFASREACERAGIGTWMTTDTQTHNSLPS